MTGTCWRLPAAFSLIFFWLIFAAPAILPGQDAAPDRASVVAPNLSPPYSLPAAPVPIPVSPGLPPRFPLGRYPGVHYPGGRYPDGVGTIAMQQLVRAAGIIFSGRVIRIGHSAASFSSDPASTTVTFQVEHALRGTTAGKNLTIHEWAGLWSSGERYRVGERVLLFLYSPGKLGLTSPVAGTMGRFATNSQGQIMMNAQQLASLAADPILGGKTVIPYPDFALAVGRSGWEE